MNPGISIYFNLLRVIAAVEVLFYHIRIRVGWSSLWTAFGHEAVVVFFVLSGYVISYSAVTKDKTPGKFVISRLVRVYSVSIPVMLLTIFLDYSGASIDPAPYEGNTPFNLPILRFLITFFLLNENWVSVQAFSNGPFWSLSYELTYYMIFASFFYFTGWTRRLLLAVALIAAGFRPFLLLPIWLLGSWAYFETRSRTWSKVVHWSLFLLAIPGFWVFKAIPLNSIHVDTVTETLGWGVSSYELAHSRQVLSDYYLGIVLTLHFLGAKNLGSQLERVLGWLRTPINALADYTFTLYLVHYPIIFFVIAVLGLGNPWLVPAILTAVTLITAILGYVTEHQRHKIKRSVVSLLNHETRSIAPMPSLVESGQRRPFHNKLLAMVSPSARE